MSNDIWMGCEQWQSHIRWLRLVWSKKPHIWFAESVCGVNKVKGSQPELHGVKACIVWFTETDLATSILVVIFCWIQAPADSEKPSAHTPPLFTGHQDVHAWVRVLFSNNHTTFASTKAESRLWRKSSGGHIHHPLSLFPQNPSVSPSWFLRTTKPGSFQDFRGATKSVERVLFWVFFGWLKCKLLIKVTAIWGHHIIWRLLVSLSQSVKHQMLATASFTVEHVLCSTVQK